MADKKLTPMMEVKIKTLKSYYVIINRKGEVSAYTIDCQRKGAIKKFIGNSKLIWNEIKKYGWKVSKVNIDFTITK